ncbi:hypothetical protein C0Q70_05922 [Pomacea canaliculata]|uniref:Alpha-macroglobulin-like TED domain-containing protein n=1 Tax=Pomacea canaliculata TaxID=400727 RepID=A0A2T7PMK4_POMCA|nr:hypothetical protein C0Q70_05922 [Pomacea canaliculata]
MITLLEALQSPLNLDTDGMVSSSISKAQLYLENELNQLTDPYELAIVTYALHLANSPQKDNALRLLEQRAITESLTTHWERPKPAVQQTYYSWQRDTDAVNVEMTSYALLTYQLRNDISKSLPIVRWLTSQRGSQGGFISTQDTVIALQALSNMAAVLYSPTSAPVTVTVGWTSGGRRHRANVTIDDSTRILLQQIEIPITGNDIPSSVEILARTNGNFSGIAVAAVNLNYNVGNRIDSDKLSLNYRVELIDDKSFILTVEFSRIDGQVGGMTLVSLGPETRTLVLPMIETNGITVKIKEIPITIADYYNPDNQKTVYYVPKDTQTTSVCDRVENYQNCSFLKKKPKKIEKG